MDKKEYLLWQAKLTELTSAQQNDLQQRLNQLKKSDTPTAATLDDWLFSGMMIRLRAKGLLFNLPLSFWLNTRAYKQYAIVSQQLRDDLDKLMPEHSRAHYRLLLASQAVDALIRWLGDKRPITTGMILRNAGHIPEALNLCFPGYVEAGMFHVVLTRNVSGARTSTTQGNIIGVL